jgi:TRAP-type C4-dicarboxylate transport system permease small subunit
MVAVLQRLDRLTAAVLRWSVIACMLAILVMLTLNIMVRMVPVFSMAGYDEVIELLYVWMTFTGAVALWREGTLFRVDVLLLTVGPRVRKALEIAILAFSLLFALLFTWWGWKFAAGTIEMTAFLMLPKNGWYMAMPVTGALMTVYTVAALWRSISPDGRAAAAPSDPR